jgi:transposase-like protein
MIIHVLHCPSCQGIAIVTHGLSPEGKQRSRCRTGLEGRGRTLLLDYAYAGQSPAVKQQSVDMAPHASGLRDTARVLHVSPTTVINALKKSAGAAASASSPIDRKRQEHATIFADNRHGYGASLMYSRCV